jgi:hypothetical protein
MADRFYREKETTMGEVTTETTAPAPATIDREKRRQELATITFSPGQMFQPKDGRELMDMANLMSTAGLMVKDIYRGSPGVCMGLIATMAPYGINPLQASWKTYQTKPDAPIAYEAQLIVAMLNASGAVKGGLRYRYEGTGQERYCIASGVLAGSKEPLEVQSPPLSQINPKNSPLWKTDPDQQLAYYTGRAWARRYKPEMLLGVYDVDEVESFVGPDNAKDVTPIPARGGARYDEPSDPWPPAEEDAQAVDGEIVDEHADLKATAETKARLGKAAFIEWWREIGAEDKEILKADMTRYQRLATDADADAAAMEDGGSAEVTGGAETGRTVDFKSVAAGIRKMIDEEIAASDIAKLYEEELAAMVSASPDLHREVTEALAAAAD